MQKVRGLTKTNIRTRAILVGIGTKCNLVTTAAIVSFSKNTNDWSSDKPLNKIVIWKFEIWKFRIWKFEIWKFNFENSEFKNLEFENSKFEYSESEHSEFEN